MIIKIHGQVPIYKIIRTSKYSAFGPTINIVETFQGYVLL